MHPELGQSCCSSSSLELRMPQLPAASTLDVASDSIENVKTKTQDKEVYFPSLPFLCARLVCAVPLVDVAVVCWWLCRVHPRRPRAAFTGAERVACTAAATRCCAARETTPVPSCAHGPGGSQQHCSL